MTRTEARSLARKEVRRTLLLLIRTMRGHKCHRKMRKSMYRTLEKLWAQ